ncbi:retrotransposon protein [Hordeum vulgare]|nr:retrotransposon protein [Hordeum vulgare]
MTLINRLQPKVTGLPDLDQGFIEGRPIVENLFYASEIIQVCQKRKAPTLMVKLDFAKAFDSVIWSSLFDILAACGFSSCWVSWVGQTLESVRSVWCF